MSKVSRFRKSLQDLCDYSVRTIEKAKSLMESKEIEQQSEGDSEEELFRIIWHAHEEWTTAENNFNYVSERELVDYSIYNIETARKRYMYLLKLAKDKNIADPHFRDSSSSN